MARRLGLQIILIAVSLLGLGVQAQAERRVALVIGNSSYQNAPRLANPGNDAVAIAALFRKAGFDRVELRRDITDAELRSIIKDFTDATRDADVAVVFYAGHGIEVSGTNYLVPVDAKLARDIDVEDETVSLDRVMRMLEPAKRLRLVILDACRDNPFAKNMKRSMTSRSIGRGLARVEITTANTLVAFAAKEGLTAADGDGLNSPFTAALVEHLAQPGLDLRLALGKVRDDVMTSTGNKQEPYVYGSLGGATVALVAAPADVARSDVPPRPAPAPVDPDDRMMRDYQLAAQIGTREAWDSFLRRYPDGFYADLARAQRSKMATLERDQFSRSEPQLPPPPQPEQRSALPPTSCPSGQRLEAGECVTDTPTSTYGAIAIGTKSNIWYGVVWGRKDEEEAKSSAMSGCLNQARKKGSTNCRMVHTFSDSCVALAWLNPGTGWGTAVRNSKSEAESAAISQCRSYNPRKRCILAGSWCSSD